MSVVREVESAAESCLPRFHTAPAAPSAHYETLKRILDVSVACVTLTLLSPVLALAAAAIKLSSPGPVLFRGTVIGRYGRPFTYYKLRTMRADADDRAHRAFIAAYVRGEARATEPDRPACGPRRRTTHPSVRTALRTAGRGTRRRDVYKLLDDPRITPVGRILRRTSLDEVAQMINVIRGEMSIVGPRPPMPYEYQLYNPYHKQRLAVLPGITGLAQVRARSRATFEEMVAIDLEYIRHRSIWGDLAIMARTVWVVLSGRGAH